MINLLNWLASASSTINYSEINNVVTVTGQPGTPLTGGTFDAIVNQANAAGMEVSIVIK